MVFVHSSLELSMFLEVLLLFFIISDKTINAFVTVWAVGPTAEIKLSFQIAVAEDQNNYRCASMG